MKIDYWNESIPSMSFFGHTIKTTANILKKVFGEPNRTSSDGKCHYIWCLKLSGTGNKYIEEPFEIYDYKYYNNFSDDKVIDWNIAGKGTEYIKKLLEEYINENSK